MEPRKSNGWLICNGCEKQIKEGEEAVTGIQVHHSSEDFECSICKCTLCRECVMEAAGLLGVKEEDIAKYWAETKSYRALKCPR